MITFQERAAAATPASAQGVSDLNVADPAGRRSTFFLATIDPAIPLVVDLDGTLVVGDTLHDNLAKVLFKAPDKLLRVAVAGAQGRAALKREAAAAAPVDAATLLYRDSVLELIRAARAEGRKVHLVTAADRSIAEAVQRHLGCFDGAEGSDDGHNLKGPNKLRRLRERFPQGFLYAGDSAADIPIWRAAKGAICVGDGARRSGALDGLGIPVLVLADAPVRTAAAWAKQLRLHQWSKNALIAVPLFTGHLLWDADALLRTLLAFVVFGLVASGTYILNDLADLEADRKHPGKRNRPIAAGRIAVMPALAAAAGLTVGGLVAAFLLAPAFFAVVAAYLALTLLYSFELKRIPLLDVAVVATLFTLRIVMGTVIHPLPLSPWLISFSCLFFLSLALAKRHVELTAAKADGRKVAGRGYIVDDWPVTLGFGIASACASIVVMLLFIADQGGSAGYQAPDRLFVIPAAVTLWLMRIWFLSHRGTLDEDPVIFALSDRVSLLLGAFVLAAGAMAG